MKPVVIGIVGCGNISEAYFKGASRSPAIRVKACADARPEAARARAAEFGVAAVSVEELLGDPEIEVVLNLTVPAAHAPVSLQILAAGKHVYLEKPLAANLGDGYRMIEAAAAAGLRIGCAPDTFFGAAHQASRQAIDAGAIGRPIGGTVAFLNHGMESWHPDPAFFYRRGGGPIHDLAPYYITQLVNLLGPVAEVTAYASIGNPTRTVGAAGGRVIDVEVPTTVNGVLRFDSGANVSLAASWDVWAHQRQPIELYGTEGSLLVPDPNFFGGAPLLSRRGAPWEPIDITDRPFGAANRTLGSGREVADYRIVGLLDMALAIRQDRPHRATGELALHVLEVLDAFEHSSLQRRHIEIRTRCARPVALGLGKGEEVFWNA